MPVCAFVIAHGVRATASSWAMKRRSVAKRLERAERCRLLGFSSGAGLPAPWSAPSAQLAKEVLRREREARPALVALLQGQAASSCARRHRNVSWHNQVIPPVGAPEAEWCEAQRGARLGVRPMGPPAVVTKYVVVEVPPVPAPGEWAAPLESSRRDVPVQTDESMIDLQAKRVILEQQYAEQQHFLEQEHAVLQDTRARFQADVQRQRATLHELQERLNQFEARLQQREQELLASEEQQRQRFQKRGARSPQRRVERGIGGQQGHPMAEPPLYPFQVTCRMQQEAAVTVQAIHGAESSVPRLFGPGAACPPAVVVHGPEAEVAPSPAAAPCMGLFAAPAVPLQDALTNALSGSIFALRSDEIQVINVTSNPGG